MSENKIMSENKEEIFICLAETRFLRISVECRMKIYDATLLDSLQMFLINSMNKRIQVQTINH